MFSTQFETLEPRQFLSGSGCDDTNDASLAHDAHTSQMLRPLGYAYPGGGGSTGGGGTNSGGSTSSARDFTARLRGTREVPSRTTTAKGSVIFRLNRAGTSLSFTIKVSGIRNVVAAHLHLGRSTVNGPVVAHLYGPQSPGGGPRSGTLATGTIKARHLTGSLDRVGRVVKALVFSGGNSPTTAARRRPAAGSSAAGACSGRAEAPPRCSPSA